MTKVTIKGGVSGGDEAAETPSEQLVRKAMQDETITDSAGRQLKMRKPGVLAQYRLIEALGDLASNQTYMQMVNPLLYLAAIDGDAVFMPGNKREVEALIQRLDDHGLAEVMGWYVANVIGPTNDAIEAAQKAADQKAALKN